MHAIMRRDPVAMRRSVGVFAGPAPAAGLLGAKPMTAAPDDQFTDGPVLCCPLGETSGATATDANGPRSLAPSPASMRGG